MSGLTYGKVRALLDEHGHRVQEALPARAVEVLGCAKVPVPGDRFLVVKDEKLARHIAVRREDAARQRLETAPHHMTLEDLYKRVQQGETRELHLVLKGDASGSVEALVASLKNLATERVQLEVIHSGVGNVNESDIMLAAASDAVVVGFRVKADPKADEVAKAEGVEMKLYDVIYEVTNNVKAAMEGLLEPTLKEVVVGDADIRKLFKVSKVGTAIGVMVTRGKLTRGDLAHVVRQGDQVIFTGKVNSLKRFKDDVKEVTAGYECGVVVEGLSDVQVGDHLQAFVEERVKTMLS